MNKKGFTYIISSIFLVAIIFSIMYAADQNFLSDRQKVEQKRISYMNDFVKGFNQDFERAIQISSFRTMVALEDHVASTGDFLNNTELSFRETVYSGTINGEEVEIMNNSCLLDYIERVIQVSQRLSLNLTVNVTRVDLTQASPWFMDVSVTTEIFISDSTSATYWNYNETYVAKVPIDNLRDPLYSVFTYNRMSNTIRQNNYSELVSGWNTSNLTTHIDNGYYLASNNSPSFIMRFENNLTPSRFGIESVVDIDALYAQDIDNIHPDRIKIDFIYFNNLSQDVYGTPYSKICNVTGMPEDFIITEDQADLYEIDSLVYSTVCP